MCLLRWQSPLLSLSLEERWFFWSVALTLCLHKPVVWFQPAIPVNTKPTGIDSNSTILRCKGFAYFCFHQIASTWASVINSFWKCSVEGESLLWIFTLVYYRPLFPCYSYFNLNKLRISFWDEDFSWAQRLMLELWSCRSPDVWSIRSKSYVACITRQNPLDFCIESAWHLLL